jgi:hypothetical protein
VNQERPTRYLDVLTEEGIRVPQSIAPLVDDLVEVERCILATGATPTGVDVYLMTLNKLFPNPRRDSVVLGHAGHGINSYQLVLAISQRGVLVVAGTGWQGIYMDAAEQVERFNSRVDLIDELLTAAAQSTGLPVPISLWKTMISEAAHKSSSLSPYPTACATR